jgi:hypothetical protein
LITFDLGEGTPLHRAIYLHADFSKENSYISLGNLKVPYTNPLIREVEGLFVKGSAGALTPSRAVEFSGRGKNLARLNLLEIIATNGGVIIEGQHNRPTAQRDIDPEWEVTPGLQLQGLYTLESPIIDDYGPKVTAFREDSKLQLSYFPGLRFTRWQESHK